MYFESLTKNYLPAIVNSEQQVYPNELVLGLKDFEKDKDSVFLDFMLN